MNSYWFNMSWSEASVDEVERERSSYGIIVQSESVANKRNSSNSSKFYPFLAQDSNYHSFFVEDHLQ